MLTLERHPKGDLLAEQDEEDHDNELELEQRLQRHHQEGQLELHDQNQQHQLDERDQLVDLLLLLATACVCDRNARITTMSAKR